MNRFLPLTIAAMLPSLASAEVPKVVTDIPAVHALSAQVMEGLGTPELLLDRGASPHHFQLRPSQAADLAEADLIVWIGPDLTPWLDRTLDGLSGNATILQLSALPGLHVQPFGAGAAHDHSDEHEHEHEHGEHQASAQDDHDGDHEHEHEHGHDHDHSGNDPHLWLDPANADLWLKAIATQLAASDPEHADTYRLNAERAAVRLNALDHELKEKLTPISAEPFAVFHDAYGYFTSHYGLMPAHALAEGDAAAPGAARLAAIRDEITSENIRCVFPEVQHDPKPLVQIIEGSGARLGSPLDPSGSGLEPGPGLYEELLTEIAETFSSCLAAAAPEK